MTDDLTRLRGLLDSTRLDREPDDSAGYLDVLGDDGEQPRTVAGLAMRSGIVASIYQRGWRQGLNLAMGTGGLGPSEERRYAAESLELSKASLVLDVACGPGNFTHVFASAVPQGGLVVGLDASRAMLAQAVTDNVVPGAAYLRADARHMPFADRTFDAICCYAALYLVPEPFTVLTDMLRVLAPGGRIALMTSYRGSWEPQRLARGALSVLSGVRMFEQGELTGVLRSAGMVDIEQEIRGAVQFVNARRPL